MPDEHSSPVAMPELFTRGHMLSQMIEFAPDMMLAVDLDYILLEANRAFCQYFQEQYGSQIGKGDNLMDRLLEFPGRVRQLQHSFLKAFSGEQVSDIATAINGNKRHFYHFSIYPLTEGERIIGAAGVIRDVKGLFKDYHLLADILDTSLQGFSFLRAVRDEEGEIIDFRYEFTNPRAAAFKNMKVREVEGKNLLAIAPHTKKSGLFDKYRLAFENSKEYEEEFYYTEDNENRWFRQIVMPKEDGLVIMTVDITGERSSEVLVKRLIDTIPYLVFLLDVQTERYVFVNPVIEHFLGVPPEAISKDAPQRWARQVHPDDLEIYKDGQARVIQLTRGEAVVSIYRIRDAHDQYRWVKVRTVPFTFDNNGNLKQVVGVAQDITERKMDEEKLRQSQEFLLESQEIGKVGSFDWDFVNHTSILTPQARQIFGFNSGADQDIALFVDRVHPDDRDLVIQAIKDALEGQSLEMEYRLYHPDGTILDVMARGRIQLDESGKPTRLIGTVADVTQSKKQEHLLREAQHLSQLGHFEYDIKNDRFHWSDELYRLHGLRPHEVQLDFQSFLQLIPEDSKQLLLQARDTILRERVPLEVEYHLLRNGEDHYIHFMARPVFNLKGEMELLTGYAQDITEQKRVEQQLRDQNRELTASNQELEQFAYVASHDLKEPLRMVSSYTDLLRQRHADKLTGDAREYLDFAAEGARRMSVLINDLLQFSRIGRINTSFDQVDLNDIALMVQHDLAPVIAAEGIELKVGQLPVVSAVQSNMVQLFQNLIGNAIKFHRGDHPVVTVTATQEKGFWHFKVTDNGIGIEERHIERIFVIFQRLHTRDQYPGTGIGLAICKKIVDFHGGHIWAESQLGEGTTIHFTLPA